MENLFILPTVIKCDELASRTSKDWNFFCLYPKSWQKPRSWQKIQSLLYSNNFLPKISSQKISHKKSSQKISPKTFLPKHSSKIIPQKKSSKKILEKLSPKFQKISKYSPKNPKYSKQFLKKFLKFWKYQIPYIALRGRRPKTLSGLFFLKHS